MGLVREPKDVDMSMKSEPWTEKELAEFRKLMQQIKARNAKRKENGLKTGGKKRVSF